MNKKGFQLSMNFLVVIIISIAILSLGVILLYNFVGETQSIKGQLDAATELEITNLLESGQKVALPFNSFKLKRGNEKSLGLGIINIYKKRKPFKIILEHSRSFQGSQDLCQIDDSFCEADEWFFYLTDRVYIDPEESSKQTIMLTIPDNAPSGTHIFNVIVYETEEDGDLGDKYGKLKKIYITVP